MKCAHKVSIALAVFIAITPFKLSAQTIVASGSQLEIATLSSDQKFDTATITITGPDGFHRQMSVSEKETGFDIGELGITQDGNYSYQIIYAQNGAVEIISDKKTGRQGSLRNLGKIETHSGFFNVKDNEFVIVTMQESEIEAEAIITFTEN